VKLPVMKTDSTPSTPDVWWGRYVELRFDYEAAVAEHEAPDVPVGRGVSRDSQPGLLLLTDAPAVDFVSSMEHAFDAAGSMRPIVVEPASTSNGEFLRNHGYFGSPGRLLRLQAAVAAAINMDRLLVVPGRAALLSLERSSQTPSVRDLGTVNLLHHLDDPQFDCMIALREGRLLGRVGIQIRGQTGLIVDWYVQPEHRNQGIGTMLLRRILELAVRSQLTDVFAAVEHLPDQTLLILEKEGFRGVCDFKLWRPPAC
jgi:GNAT superfamily N-acetyltransferase